jgi:hypothetical protein
VYNVSDDLAAYMTYSLDMGFPKYYKTFMETQPDFYGSLIKKNNQELHSVLTQYNMDILSLFQSLAIT